MSSSGLRFYREVRRALRKLPPNAQDYYYAVVAREKFVAHRDEDDAARVELIVRKSREDLRWVLRKYSSSSDGGDGDGAAGKPDRPKLA